MYDTKLKKIAGMKVRVLGVQDSSMLITVNPPVTLSSLKAKIEHHGIASVSEYALFRKQRLIARRDMLIPEDGSDEIVVTLVNKSDFPVKAFPMSDFSLALDRHRFARKPISEDFPDIDVPPFMRRTRDGAHMRDMIGDIAGSLNDVSITPQPERTESRQNRRLRDFGSLVQTTPEEEQIGEEEEEMYKEDDDAIMELRDSFEENLSVNDERVIEELSHLGFDRSFITPILFMCQGDEVVTRELLERALEQMS